MTYRMVLAGILLVSAAAVVAAESENPTTPQSQPPATSTDAAPQPADGDQSNAAPAKETGQPKDAPAAGAAEPDCE